MNATTATFPCVTWTRAGRICGKPASEAQYRGDHQFEPICSFHLKVANRRYGQRATVAISGDVATALTEERDARRASQEAAAAAKYAESVRQADLVTARLWAEAESEWEVVYAPEQREDWSAYAAAREAGLTGDDLAAASTRLEPRWFIQPISDRAGYDRWEVQVEQQAGRPAYVSVRRAGSATAAAAAALAEALIAAGAVAAGLTAAAKEARND